MSTFTYWVDETSWNLFVGDGFRRYAWTMVGGESDDAVFILGKTRGKGNATDLLGDSEATLVSDDYAAYRGRDKHQLCWAHIVRKLRDLARSGEIAGEQRDRFLAAYKTFAVIYADIKEARSSKTPTACYDELLRRLSSFSDPDPVDCAKLARIRKLSPPSLRSRQQRRRAIASPPRAQEKNIIRLLLEENRRDIGNPPLGLDVI